MEEIFKPNNHSRFEIQWRSIEPSVYKEVSAIAKKYYGIENIKDIRQVDEWEQYSNNFRVTYKANGETKEILIRKNIRVKDVKIIENIHSISLFLASRGIKVPQFVKTNEGSLAVIDKESLWTAIDFIDGNHFSGTPEELAAIGLEVAKIHKAFREHAETYPELAAFMWEMPEVTPVFEKMKEIDIGLRAMVLSKEKMMKEIASDTLLKRKKQTKKNLQIIHNDFHPHNTIFKDGSLSAVIDFDNIRYAELLVDLGQALHRFSRQYMVFAGSTSPRDLDKAVEIFLDNYRTISNISLEDAESIPYFIREGLFRKIASDVRKLLESESPEKHIGEAKKFMLLLEETVPLESSIHAYAKKKRKRN